MAEEEREGNRDVTFETVKAVEITFGTNNFVEVAKKKAITAEGENEFISISRGFFAQGDPEKKRFRKSVSMPAEKAKVDELLKALKDISK